MRRPGADDEDAGSESGELFVGSALHPATEVKGCKYTWVNNRWKNICHRTCGRVCHKVFGKKRDAVESPEMMYKVLYILSFHYSIQF